MWGGLRRVSRPAVFLPHPCKKRHRRYSYIRNCKEGRYYDADTENARRSDHCGSARFRLNLLRSAVSSMIQIKDGIRVRQISNHKPVPNAQLVDASLEDACLYALEGASL